MTDRGFILIFRSIQANWVWHSKPFSQGQAWIDLLIQSAFTTHNVKPGMSVERGQLWTTLRFLGDRWGWSKNKVASFIDKIEADKMIITKRDTKRDTGGTLITIVNYDSYQDTKRDTNDDANGTQTGHRRDYHKEGKKETNISNGLFDDAEGPGNGNGKKPRKPKLCMTPAQIEEIYLAYPRREGPDDAMKAIGQAFEDRETREAAQWHEERTDKDNCDMVYEFLLERTKLFAKFCADTKKERKYTRLAGTWFRAKDYMIDHATNKHYMHDVTY